MTKKVVIPCEAAVKDVIPAVKALFSITLSERGYSQKEIAEILGISVAEVNYLIKGKRGDNEIRKKLENDSDFLDMLNSFVNKIQLYDGDSESLSLCPLCSYARRKILKQKDACPYDII